jgi:hypothetical protein
MPMLSALHGWSMGQSDVVIAYHQADVSTDHVYIAISKGFDSHCLPILKSIYRVQEVGITGDQYLVKGLKESVCKLSQSDKWVFYQGNTIFMIYVDEGTLIDPRLKKPCWTCCFSLYKWDLSDYLAVKVRQPPDGSIELVRVQSIDSTLEDLKLVDHGVGNQVKTYCTHDGKMKRDEGGKEFDCSLGYKSVIGNLNYLEKFTMGNIVISVHPCSWYLSLPMKFYDEAAN